MESTNNLTPQEAKLVAAKNDRVKRAARILELKLEIKELEAEARKVKESAPEEQMLVDQWTGNLQALKQQFVYDLTAKVAQGKIPIINFGTPEALAFINADRWIKAIPELAEQVSGRKGMARTARALNIINDELSVLRSEYCALGGV